MAGGVRIPGARGEGAGAAGCGAAPRPARGRQPRGRLPAGVRARAPPRRPSRWRVPCRAAAQGADPRRSVAGAGRTVEAKGAGGWARRGAEREAGRGTARTFGGGPAGRPRPPAAASAAPAADPGPAASAEPPHAGVVGTAGHVDHGKTALVRALTGVDTDRLPEEKRRGISIDLGFAELALPDGRRAAVVDVPGHERFVKNMVAGASGIDACLLVVACDEGVMPQTREHVEIASLLGVTRAVVALRKRDLVDEAWLELVREDMARLLAPTALAGAEMVPVSVVTDEGLERLRARLADLLDGAAGRQDRGFARLPVDRVFSVAGFGTVVTGTLTSGAIALEDRLELQPAGLPVRVRGLQVHGRPVPRARAGQRVAANLAGAERAAVRRGDVLATPGTLSAETLLAVRLFALAPGPAGSARAALKHGQRLHVHVGTAEAVGRLHLLEGEELAAGGSAFAELRLERPVAAARGDRFIVRSYSPVTTVGGGVVLDTGRRRRRRDPQALAALAVLERGQPAEVVLASAPAAVPVPAAELARRSGLPPGEAEAAVRELLARGALAQVGGAGDAALLLSARGWEELRHRVLARVADYHARHPLRPGMPREELRRAAMEACDARAAAAVVERLAQAGELRLDGDRVALPGFAPRLPPELAAAAERLQAALAAAGVAPPSAAEALAAAGFPADEAVRAEVLAHLLDRGAVVRVGEFCYAAEAMARVTDAVRSYLRAHGTMTVAELRDLLGVTRKHAVPLAEYLDASRVTRRAGDVRRLA